MSALPEAAAEAEAKAETETKRRPATEGRPRRDVAVVCIAADVVLSL